jgi:hypothetical protein
MTNCNKRGSVENDIRLVKSAVFAIFGVGFFLFSILVYGCDRGYQIKNNIVSGQPGAITGTLNGDDVTGNVGFNTDKQGNLILDGVIPENPGVVFIQIIRVEAEVPKTIKTSADTDVGYNP